MGAVTALEAGKTNSVKTTTVKKSSSSTRAGIAVKKHSVSKVTTKKVAKTSKKS